MLTGVTTIKWGSDGMLGSYTVKDVAPADDIEQINIENGVGIPSTRVMLVKGRTVDITVIDDSGIAAPKINTVVSVIDQLVNGGNVTTNYRVVGKNGRAARKVEADLIIRAEHLTNIEGGGNPITNQVSTDGT